MKRSNTAQPRWARCVERGREGRPGGSPSHGRGAILLWVWILLATLASSGGAQIVGKISGVVKDRQTGEPVIGVNVAVVGTKMGGVTDAEGSYFILNVTPGQYDIQASMVGYGCVVEQGIIVNSGRTTTVNFRMSATAIEQKAVIVQAVRPDVEKEKTSTSTVFRTEDVAALAGMRDVNDVIGLAADITDDHFRGGTSR